MKKILELAVLSTIITTGLTSKVSASTSDKKLAKYQPKSIEVYFLNSPIYPKGLTVKEKEKMQNTELKRQRMEMYRSARDPILERDKGWYPAEVRLFTIRF